MPEVIPDARRVFPICLPDGTSHKGTVFLSNVIDNPRFKVEDYSYASDFDPPPLSGWSERLAPYLFAMSRETLHIGGFCQIAHGVRFITASANHAMTGLTSFPFAVFDQHAMLGYQPDTRDTIIGNDVWLGYGAIVCPGARIGNGAIIGAGSVVRGQVPDYAVVAGNPAVVVRMRYSDTEIAALNRLAWWNWPIDRIAAARPALEAGEVVELATYA